MFFETQCIYRFPRKSLFLLLPVEFWQKIITITAVADSSDPLVSAAREIPRLPRVVAANYHPVIASSEPAVLRRSDVRASRGYTCNIQMTKIRDEMQDLCQTFCMEQSPSI